MFSLKCQRTFANILKIQQNVSRKWASFVPSPARSLKTSSCISVFSSFKVLNGVSRNTFHTKGKGHNIFVGYQHKAFSMKSPFELNRNRLVQDVLVYSHKNDNFYKVLSYFGLFQLAMWGYLSLFAVQHLKKAPAAIKDVSDLPFWKRFLYKEGQYKNAISVLCLFVGGTVLFITMTYPKRAIRSMWLLKGGKEVKITTYSFLGKTQTFTKPVEHLNCLQARTGPGQHIPLKIKDKTFYYLLDKKGSFHNTDLFDFVIGVKRNIS